MTQDDARSDCLDSNERDIASCYRRSSLFSRITKDDMRRSIALENIFTRDRRGVVDGVEFDLRHELIDPDNWRSYTLGIERVPWRCSNRPFIWFPWNGIFDGESLRAEMIEHCARETEPRSEEFFDSWLHLHTPDHFMKVGDSLTVERVERVTLHGPFSYKHDQEFRRAYLRIKRSDGKSERVKAPLVFAGSMTMFAPTATGEHFYTLVSRITDHFKIGSLSELNSAHDESSYAWNALVTARSIELSTEAIRPTAEGIPVAEAEFTAWKTWLLVNQAIALGYLWAKAEDEIGMRPLAESAVRAKIGGARGGRKSGEARRNVRAKTWEPHARELATEIRNANPSYSQDRVAIEIASRWKKTNFEPPSHQTLKALVSTMEKEGKIAFRTRAR